MKVSTSVLLQFACCEDYLFQSQECTTIIKAYYNFLILRDKVLSMIKKEQGPEQFNWLDMNMNYLLHNEVDTPG